MSPYVVSTSSEASSAQRRGAILPRVVGVVGFAVLTAASARLAVPLPGTAVPATLQVGAVLLSGFLLGPRLGAASQLLYLAAGVSGLPAFAAGGGAAYLLGPTGGYLLAFPVAAALAGALAGRGRRLLPHLAGGIAGLAAIHLGGLAWLTIGIGAEAALRVGLLPFLVADSLKLILAVLVSIGLRERALKLLAGR